MATNLYKLKSNLNADLILPKSTSDPIPLRMVKYGQTFMADEYLYTAVQKHVLLIETVSKDDNVDFDFKNKFEKQQSNSENLNNTRSLNRSRNKNDVTESIQLTELFFQRWHIYFGERGARANQLLTLYRELHNVTNISSTAFGMALKRCKPAGWKIEGVQSGHSNKYILQKR